MYGCCSSAFVFTIFTFIRERKVDLGGRGRGTESAAYFFKLPTLQFAFRGDFGRGRALLLEVMDG